jgi:hypothetical protein
MFTRLYRSHQDAFLAVFIGLWVYLFLVLVAPFDVAPLGLGWRAQLMLGYGLICAITYWVSASVLNKLVFYQKQTPWIQQLLLAVTYPIVTFLPTYGYYASDLVLGEYGLLRFTLEIYASSFLLLLPIILIGQFGIAQLLTSADKKILLRGENKLDVLQLHPSDLLYIKTAQNYVEVHYLLDGAPHKKLLRTTLKRIANSLPFLTQTHRSYLVNLEHFRAWESQREIAIGSNTVPVSSSFHPSVMEALPVRP